MTRPGIGVRLARPGMRAHAEYHREESPPFRGVTFAAVPGFPSDVMDRQVDTVTAEVVGRGLLLGYSNAETETPGHPLRNGSVLTRTVGAGFCQPRGPSAALTCRIEETGERVKRTDERLEVRAPGLFWRF